MFLPSRELVHRKERGEEKGGGKLDRVWKETTVEMHMSVIWGVTFKRKYEAFLIYRGDWIHI